MALHKKTSIKHLSYQELDNLLRSLAMQMRSTGKVFTLTPASKDDEIVTYLLSEFTGYNVEHKPSSLRVSLIGDPGIDVCIYSKQYVSDLYNRQTKFSLETLYQEEDESFTQITLPWKK